MQIHPLCALVPDMSEAEFGDLVDSMREHGYDKRFPVWTLDGKILDGRHRYEAAKKAKVEPVYAEWKPRDDKDTPALFVLRAMTRRNLTPAQRAAAAVTLAPPLAVDALRRMQAGAKQHRASAKSARKSDPGGAAPPGCQNPNRRDEEARTSAKVAKILNVGHRAVRVAFAARNRPEIMEKMRSGEITVAEANRLMKPAPVPAMPPPVGSVQHPALGVAHRFADLAESLQAAKREVVALSKHPGGARIREQEITTPLARIIEAIKHAAPFAACAACAATHGTGKCELCHGTGYVTEHELASMPRW